MVSPLTGISHVDVDVGASGQPVAVLSLEHLSVTFGNMRAVRDLSLHVAAGECLGVVGESGAGKSQAFLAALGLLAPNGRATGSARFGSVDLLALRPSELDQIRAPRI